MKKYMLLLIAITGIAICAFTSYQNNLTAQLIGEWRNTYMRVNIATYNNTNRSSLMQADSTNWEKRLGIHPIRTHFKSDGTYYSEYFNLKDSLIRKPSGIWSTKGDSLIMVQLLPDKYTTKMRVQMAQNNVAVFTGMIDFDGDGKADDEYYGMQKKVGPQ